MKINAFRRSQSMLTYAAMVAFLIAAAMMTFFYVRRALQGKYRESADVFGEGAQYQPGVTHAE